MKYHEWWSEAAGVKLKHPRGGTGGSAVLSHIVPSVELLQQVLHGVDRTQQTGRNPHAQPTGKGGPRGPNPRSRPCYFRDFKFC